MLNWKEVKEIVARHSLSRKNPAATPWDGLLLGNADMGAIVFGPAYRLCFRLTKMDLWDARMNLDHYKPSLPLSKFKQWAFEESKKLKRGQVIPVNTNNECWGNNSDVYPCLRMGADFMVRVCQNAYLLPTPMEQRLRLEDGVHQARFILGWWVERPAVVCETFVSWQNNVMCMRLVFPKQFRRNAVVSLWREPYGGRSWESLSSGPSIKDVPENKTSWTRDPRRGMLPPAQIAATGNRATLRQTIPGDRHCPERGFSVVALCAEQGAEFFMEPSGHAALEQLDHGELTFFVAIASDMEGPDATKRAMALAEQAAAEGYDSLYARHARAWQEFWMQSAVELEDATLERRFVRSSYSLAINARKGRPSPGLFGVSVACDCPPWRGDRHNDYPEFSGLFWGAFASNHAEQAVNYSEFVFNYLPVARRIAREIYECPRGAAYPCTYIDGSELYWFLPTWGRILWLTAGHAQNCWWHYQYFRDRDFLCTVAYPVMRECADFYVELVRKNPSGDYALWPTIACEIRGWTKDFELNRNCIEDIAHVKFLLRATLEAAEILGADADRRPEWRDLLEHLPHYPTLNIEGKEEFTDFAGQDKRPAYNHSVPIAPFWPAEDPDIYANPGLREIGVNTLSVHPWDHTRLMIAYMRLGMKDKVWEKMLGQKPEKSDDSNVGWPSCGDTFLICEMLLTSWDGVLRLFPAWPLEKKARFRDLRAKGAFLVSASCERGQIMGVTVRSERGNPLTIQSPWTKAHVFSQTAGREVTPSHDGDLLRFNTSPCEIYRLEQRF